ncbi:hypothetical protein GCM10017559_76660 [Streptosporangium longisporum]|uniref:Uncharacterized protein n=1 Tax=Streptosporangium longisporum TaxID=46187 RepID=A0ABP6LFB3_9ACTN
MIFGVLKRVGVVRRESFTLPTFDPQTDRVTGHISAEYLAAELIDAFGLCEHSETRCEECDPEE